MISKHSTIPVPDSLQAPQKNQFYLPFFDTSFILDDVKLAELSNNSFE